MPKGKTGLLVTILFTLLSFSISGSEGNNINDPFFQKLEKDFLCVDGCGMALVDCSNKTAEQMRLDLFNFIDQGRTEIEIKTYMAGIYGNEVL
ncbi:MAG: cytochrome c-type biogenesis protein CcmH, partial [Spirochaetales bacterium]|nr:cytochrome c-type biogenesis protein CcmH [Spirochaetales bacterium]